jgi:hypothetical protein
MYMKSTVKQFVAAPRSLTAAPLRAIVGVLGPPLGMQPIGGPQRLSEGLEARE